MIIEKNHHQPLNCHRYGLLDIQTQICYGSCQLDYPSLEKD